MNIPNDLKYSKNHEWAKLEENIVTIGITDYAQGELGDVVFVELPEVDEQLATNEVFGSVEAVKAVSDLYLPISGTIFEINQKLEGTPDLVNKDAYGEGWMIKIKIENKDEFENLLSAEDYKKLL